MKMHVLIIDDDPQELTSFMEILKNIKEPIRLTYAQCGRQAIDLLQHTTPDFIFIDCELSEMNALQVLSAVRFQTKFKETKVYLYSEHFSDDTSKMARMLGATGCIEKSGEFSNLVHRFKAIFSPELLPSYVFLKNYQPAAFFCHNAYFLNTVDDGDQTKQQVYQKTGNLYGSAIDNDFNNERSAGSVEVNPVSFHGSLP